MIKKIQDKGVLIGALCGKIKQAADIAGTIIATQRAYMETLAAGKGFFGIPLAKIVLAQGALAVAAIASQKPPKMEQGGLIGGRRHSQGGTMIEAERGEYVVSRRGVEAAGIEALNRINAGAGGGGSGFTESGGAGGTSQRAIDVTNVSSVSVTVGNPGGGTNYSGSVSYTHLTVPTKRIV